MNITSFNPLILTKNGEETIKFFEALGFEKRHTNENVDDLGITNVSMKNEGGFKVDIAYPVQLDQDKVIIRMNVSDFEEAAEFLKSQGFVSPRGDHTVDMKSSKSAMMVSPSGFAFDLCQHIK